MKQTKILFQVLLLLVVWQGIVRAQTNTLQHNTALIDRCGTETPANYRTWRNSVVGNRNMVTTLKHDTCLNKKFSVVFYVVLDSNYQWGGGLTAASLTTCINNLNNAFKPICVSFMNCSTAVIPNFPYNRWYKTVTDPIVTSNWYTDKTINIYLVDTIKLPSGASGYAYFPGGKDAIVIEKNAIGGTTPIHEMGHFFGLVHTFDDISGPIPTSTVVPNPSQPLTTELVTRSVTGRNCYTNGDGFCDTDADCFSQSVSALAPCGFLHGPKDASNEYFIPPVDNYMTYYKPCRCRFTQEQYNFMANVILTQRLYLH